MTYRGQVNNGQILLHPSVRLPEGAQVDVLLVDDPAKVPASRQEILKLPIEQRRNLLMHQSERLAPHYEPDPDRSEWQWGHH
jgi:hypothetical protein